MSFTARQLADWRALRAIAQIGKLSRELEKAALEKVLRGELEKA